MRTGRTIRNHLISVGLAGLAGCTRQTALEEEHTVSWYVEHADERTAKGKWCNEDVARASSPNCINAEQAGERLATTPNAPNVSTGAKIP